MPDETLQPPPASGEGAAPATLSEQSAAISRLVVRTTAEHTGRGPTKAHTTIDDGAIFVVLRDSMTKGEHTLLDSGRAETVQRMRRDFQGTMRVELIAGVEAITGRTVDAFLSASHDDPDVSVEVFVLARD